jgi:cell division control protein 45
LGLSEQYFLNRIEEKEYQKEIKYFLAQVSEKNATSQELDLDDAILQTINFTSEFKIPLYRHWNLYDSIFHSRYIATRFAIWREVGMKKFKTLLVKIGIPLVESRNNWISMKTEFKSLVQDSFVPVCKEFNLEDLIFPSFYKVGEKFYDHHTDILQNMGFKTQISAMDAVFACSALLEINSTDSYWKAYDSISE